MYELGGTGAVASELAQATQQLRSISHRVAQAAQRAPRRDASGWDGLAAWAYQHALDRLTRDLDAAQALLRSAGDLTQLAGFEVGND